jgi:hypothetical protein
MEAKYSETFVLEFRPKVFHKIDSGTKLTANPLIRPTQAGKNFAVGPNSRMKTDLLLKVRSKDTLFAFSTPLTIWSA